MVFLDLFKKKDTDNFDNIYIRDKTNKSFDTVDSDPDSESDSLTKDEEKIKIINYFKLLYKFLGDKHCFTFGSFVIEDEKLQLYNLLKKAFDLKLPKWQESHTKFKKEEEEMYEIHFPFNKRNLSDESNFIISCICDNDEIEERKIQNLKFYKFNENGNNFVYIKLEYYATTSPKHWLNAANRYIRGKENKSCKLVRREDCKKNDSCIKKDNPNPLLTNNSTDDDEYKKLTTYENITIDDIICDITDKHKRVGDEFFVPQCINEYFFKDEENVKNPEEIEFIPEGENNLIINAKPSQMGGKMKKKSMKKKSRKTKKSMKKKKSRKNKKNHNK